MRLRFSLGLGLALLAASFCGPSATAQKVRSSGSPGEQLAHLFDTGCLIKTDVSLVRRLLRQGASIQTQSNRGITVLMYAACCAGDLPLLKAALKGGVDVNARTKDGGMTALMWAMNSRSVDKLKVLLEAGADVNARDEIGRTPLMLASEFKFREGMKLLLARGADINARNEKGHTALAYAAGHPGLVRLLQQNGIQR
jgi:uncharacterized protein